MAEYRSNNNGASAFVTGLLVGGLVSATATLLMAPRSGKETRAQLLRTGIELRDEAIGSVDTMAAQVTRKGQEITSDIQEKVGGIKRRGQDLIEEQREHLAAAIAGEDSRAQARSK